MIYRFSFHKIQPRYVYVPLRAVQTAPTLESTLIINDIAAPTAATKVYRRINNNLVDENKFLNVVVKRLYTTTSTVTVTAVKRYLSSKQIVVRRRRRRFPTRVSARGPLIFIFYSLVMGVTGGRRAGKRVRSTQ